MPLPTLSVPTYELSLPSTGKKVKYRPFLVKEEKVLLLAMESEDEKEVERAVKQTLTAWVFSEFDSERRSYFSFVPAEQDSS